MFINTHFIVKRIKCSVTLVLGSNQFAFKNFECCHSLIRRHQKTHGSISVLRSKILWFECVRTEMNGLLLYSLLGRGYLSTTEKIETVPPNTMESADIDVARSSIWAEDPDELPVK